MSRTPSATGWMAPGGVFLAALLSLAVGPVRAAGEDLFRALKIVRFSKPVTPPDFSLPDLGGKAVKLSDFRGKVLLLNFWTTWCPYCARERSALESLYQKYKDRGLVVVAVDMGEPVDLVRAYVARRGLSFPHLLDAQYEVSVMFSVRGTPTNFLINRRGEVLGGAVGYRDWQSKEAAQLFEYLLARD